MVATRRPATDTTTRLVRLMVGRDVGDIYPPGATRARRDVLGVAASGARASSTTSTSTSVRARSSASRPRRLRPDRGPAGDHGADPGDGGEIEVFGERGAHRVAARRHRAGHRPADRGPQDRGLLLQQTVAPNVTVSRFADVAQPWHPATRARARWCAATSSADDPHARPGARSSATCRGGNQQKVILAKWLHAECRDPPDRRADARRRRRRQARDLPAPARPRRRRRGDRHGVVGAARDPRHERPHPRHARGTGERRTSSVRGDRRAVMNLATRHDAEARPRVGGVPGAGWRPIGDGPRRSARRQPGSPRC